MRTNNNKSAQKNFALPGWPLHKLSCNVLLQKLLLLVMLLMGQMSVYAATPPNTELLNTVYVEFQVGEGATVSAQASALTTTTDRTPAQIDFYAVFEGGQTMSLPVTEYGDGVSGGNTLWQSVNHNLPTSVVADETTNFAPGENLLVRVEDFDQNIDASVRETIIITLETSDGDIETLRLTETAPDSGVFFGVIPTEGSADSPNYNGILSVERSTEVTASYRDNNDVTDTAVAAILIDPVSLVFDSTTGEPISGVEINLVHDKSGQSARAYDTDGTNWPNPVMSGSTVSSRSANKYSPVMAKGEFRFPRVLAGEYRLEIIPPPGYRYPTQLSDAQLSQLGAVAQKVIIGSRGERFELAKALDTIELHVPLDPFTGRFGVRKTVDHEIAAIGDIVKYTIVAQNHDLRYPLSNVFLEDLLPPGFRYIAGSAKYGDGEVFPQEKINVDGRLLSLKLGTLEAGKNVTITYHVRTGAASVDASGTAVNKVQGFSDDATSNVARAEVRLLDELMRDKGLIIGRVYRGSCDDTEQQKGVADVRLYLENGRSVVTDKYGRWHMAGVKPGTHVVQLDTVSLPKGYALAPCKMTARNAGKAFSEFVEIKGGNLWRVDFRLQQEGGNNEAEGSATDSGTQQPDDPLQQFGNDYVAKAGPGLEILWPPPRYVPAISSIKIAVKYPTGQKLKVLLNGEKVNPLNREGSSKNKAKTVSITRWSGVDIKQKNNILTAIVTDKSGREVGRAERHVHFTERGVSATLVESESTLVADGKKRPVIALRIEDEDGYTLRPRTHGYFTLEHPHWVPDQSESAEQENLELNTRRQNGRYEYTVSNDGLVRIPFEPTSRTGEVVLNVELSDGEQATVRAWLKPALRDWIMVGFAKGTLGYKTLSGNLQTLEDLNQQEGYYREGQVSFFAKGRIKGKYLLTVAYDSSREVGEVGAQLQGNIDPDAWYKLYGDKRTEQYEAPTSGKLFLKLEKEQFSALFGDFQTSLDVTELSAYERVLHGLKSEYKGDNFSYKVFASQTGNQHRRDLISPDGTSGLYYLSQEPLANSEKIVLETRDRDHPEIITNTRALTRYVDYEVDYLERSLFFKFPVSSSDNQLNPVLIVVDYEVSNDQRGKAITAGGRVAYTTDDEKLKTGLSYIREGDENQQYGLDARYQASDTLSLRAEVAQSGGNEKAMAWLTEAEYAKDGLNVRAYSREEEEGFGLSQQGVSSQDRRKSGLEARYALGLDSVLSFDTYYEVMSSDTDPTENKRLQSSIQWEKDFDNSQFSIGVRHTTEDSGIGRESNRQIIVGGRTHILDDKVSLSAKLEKSLDGDQQSAAPDRARLGLEYQLNDKTEVTLEQEWSLSGEDRTNNTRLGIQAKPWEGGRVHSGVVHEQKTGIGSSQRDYANFGLSQQWQVNEKLSLDASVDKVKTLRQSHILGDEENLPQPQNNDFATVSLGAGWNDEDWSAAGRVEYLSGNVSDKKLLTLGVVRELSEEHSVAGNLRVTEASQANGDVKRKSELGLHVAVRPNDKGSWFNRLDFSDEKSVTGEAQSSTRKIINNMHYNRQLSEDMELSFHHGIKLNLTDDGNGGYRSLLDTMQAAVRLDISDDLDIGVQGGYLQNWDSETRAYFSGVAAGFSPAENTRIEVGYNFSGFEDEDFDSGNHTFQGPFINLNYKLDQDLMKQLREREQ